jgi:hypothetical protein
MVKVRRVLPRTAGCGVPPVRLSLGDLRCFVLGFREPTRGERRELRTEAELIAFVGRWSADPDKWSRPGAYDAAAELHKIQERSRNPERWVSTPSGLAWGGLCRERNRFFGHGSTIGGSWSRAAGAAV